MDEMKKLYQQIAVLHSEMELILKQIENQNTIHVLDIDLLLEKTRALYETGLKLKNQASSGLYSPQPFQAQTEQTASRKIEQKAEPITEKSQIVENITKKAVFTSAMDFEIPPPEKEDGNDLPEGKLPDFSPTPEHLTQPIELEITRNKGSNDPAPSKIIVKTEDLADLSKTTAKKRQPFQTIVPSEQEKTKEEPALAKEKETTARHGKKHKKEEDKKGNIIADKFETSQSVYDKIGNRQPAGNLASRLTDTPVSDLRKAIRLNDKLLFIKDLFGGDPQLYENALDQINNTISFSEALRLLETTFHTDMNKEAARHFTSLLKRKFNE